MARRGDQSRKIENSVADFCRAVDERGVVDLRRLHNPTDDKMTMVETRGPILARIKDLLKEAEMLLEGLDISNEAGIIENPEAKWGQQEGMTHEETITTQQRQYPKPKTTHGKTTQT